MGYMKIPNLYKEKEIMEKHMECYAMEKIHGTSTNIQYIHEDKKLKFFAGGCKHETFVNIFNQEKLLEKIDLLGIDEDFIIYGEGYGGKCQRMSATYGKELKFVAFDVFVGGRFLNVPDAERIVKFLGLEFVDYVKTTTDIESLDKEKTKHSIQAIRNGLGEGKEREGIVIKPLVESLDRFGKRLIVKHKNDSFRETRTPRFTTEQLKVLEDAKEIAEEWVTQMRLEHILDKMPKDLEMKDIPTIQNKMLEDVYLEAEGEIVHSREATKAIKNKTANLFKEYIKKGLNN